LEPGGARCCAPPRPQERNGDVNPGNVLFGGKPRSESSPALDRGASAFYGEHRRFRNHHPVAGAGPLTQPIRLSSCNLLARGELDGAEGIDGAEI
jgi:hypothetical protein